jgi:DNA (cytosine-5)-methyltransferase 1
LVVLRGTEPSHISGGAKGIDEPLPTITANGYHMALATPTAEPVSLPGQGHPFVLGQQSCAAPRSVDDPVPTITTDGYIRLFTADAKPILVSVTGADKPKSVRSVDEPLATITTKNGTGLAEPVLVKLKGKSDAADIDQPAPTITTVQQLALAEPLIAPYYGGGSGETCNSVDEPLPTVTTKARFSLIEPAAEPFIVSPRHARPGAGPGPRSVNDPLPTITAGGSQVALVDSQVQPLSAVDFAHLEALSREDRLVMIDGTLHVIDVLFRMIFNDELARATGLDDYEFAGTSHDITKQIGNAVPVHGATALIHDFMSV